MHGGLKILSSTPTTQILCHGVWFLKNGIYICDLRLARWWQRNTLLWEVQSLRLEIRVLGLNVSNTVMFDILNDWATVSVTFVATLNSEITESHYRTKMKHRVAYA